MPRQCTKADGRDGVLGGVLVGVGAGVLCRRSRSTVRRLEGARRGRLVGRWPPSYRGSRHWGVSGRADCRWSLVSGSWRSKRAADGAVSGRWRGRGGVHAEAAARAHPGQRARPAIYRHVAPSLRPSGHMAPQDSRWLRSPRWCRWCLPRWCRSSRPTRKQTPGREAAANWIHVGWTALGPKRRRACR